MVMGIPDWDKGIGRAQAMCRSAGLNLHVIDQAEVNNILGRPESNPKWAEAFKCHYPDADLEVIGTLAVRMALIKVASENSAQAVITGANLEDLLSESVFALLRGQAPMSFPVREIDGTKFWYPLFRCPKRVIDGCNPKFSLQNYENRDPSNLYWRAASYYMAQQFSCALPSIEQHILEVFRRLAQTSNRKPQYCPDLGFSTSGPLNQDSIRKWNRYISGE